MYLQTPKRPNLPPTPLAYGSSTKTSLPPLSSILANGDEGAPKYSTMHKLPSVDSLTAPNTQAPGLSSSHYLTQQFTFRHPTSQNIQTPSKRARNMPMPTPISTNPNSSFDTSDNDISINGGEVITKKSKISPTNEKSYAFISHSPVTFPSQEPSIDNAPLARRKRRRTSPNELSILNNEFEIGQTPNKLRRIEIADKVSMTEKAVQIWFQNKRQSLRKQSNVEKEITELPSTIPISTPIKPTLQKAESQPFIPSPSAVARTQRARSSTSLPTTHTNTITPISQRTVFSSISTPNTSYLNYDDTNTSIDSTSPNLVLNETSKKQPVSLNSNNSSTMTFKLMPARPASVNSSKISQKLANESLNSENASEEKSVTKKANLQGLLNSASTSTSTTKRVPLGEVDVNTNQSKPLKKQNEKECIKNLLSLRAGNWN